MHVYLHNPSNKRLLATSVDESYTLRGHFAQFGDETITVAQLFGPIPDARDELSGATVRLQRASDAATLALEGTSRDGEEA